MIEFLLVFMIDTEIVNQTQRFKSVDRCLYFAERLSNQPMIPKAEGMPSKITAYCKPVRKKTSRGKKPGS
jgi:hypothetical protein|tara:strand:- start:17 stop:226 length:210 start_codon:yes stop_codon:yes gene_type:complete